MEFNLKKKVADLQLRPSEYLLPLFEVIVNSIHSIIESKRPDGRIMVEIKRNIVQQGAIFEENPELGYIEGFNVTDNGIGFNKDNFKSFNTAYTDYKLKHGCKGIGRFLVLKAFKEMYIDSTYSEKNTLKHREISFTLDNEVKVLSENGILPQNIETKIELRAYLPEYRSKTSLETVADKLLEHCLIFFITRKAPLIIIEDEGKQINLTSLFDTKMSFEGLMDNFKIGDNNFDVYYIKEYDKKGNTHKVHYCADDREALTKNVNSFVPSFIRSLTDEVQGEYYLSIYITSKYLDTHVNSERTKFPIPIKEIDEDLASPISMERINNEIKKSIYKHFENDLKETEENVLNDYQEFIKNKAPEYRHLIQLLDQHLDKLSVDADGDKKDMILHQINHEYEKKQKIKVETLLHQEIDPKNPEKYTDALIEVLQSEQDFSYAKLANYLVRRKTIIKMFEKLLEIKESGSYELERHIHSLIFPMKKDSNNITYNEHNLWMLDERLVFHTYVASDMEFKKMSEGVIQDDDKPDLIIFDKPFVYSEDNEYSSIIIFEFKRPGRRDNDVLKQVQDYISKICDNILQNYKGRPVKIKQTTPIYCYIVCDLDDKLEKALRRNNNFKKTPEQEGLFCYFEDTNAYVEIITYNKLLKDVEKRHSAFFKELGLKY
ncbi:hypothetical protein AD998_01950 [bacterium 336/3]|nr:hypothetical protein AD998_01950 [bacterium 336/3]